MAGSIERPFCQAVTRRQLEAASWAMSRQGCGRRATVRDEQAGAWFCRQHSDPDKRYGVNR